MKFRRKRRLFTSIVAVEGVRIQRQRGSISPLSTVIFPVRLVGQVSHRTSEWREHWPMIETGVKQCAAAFMRV